MTKKALVVGINDYAPIGTGGPDLNGCVNDARDMANTLVICGFAPANVRIITNQNATRANIISYLGWLLNGCVSGDSLVFYYSGHGTRVANIGPDLEIDGLDEAICPHDYATAGVLRDDDFKAIFDSKVKPGVNFEVIFDGDFANETPRFITPMLEDEFYFSYAKELKPKKSKKDSDSSKTTKALVPVAGLNHTLWAACKDNQVSMEATIAGSVRGYFTYYFCKILRATSGNITRRLLDAQTANALAAAGVAQINQTESLAAEFSQRIFT
jgi:metacaspase-1